MNINQRRRNHGNEDNEFDSNYDNSYNSNQDNIGNKDSNSVVSYMNDSNNESDDDEINNSGIVSGIESSYMHDISFCIH